MSVCSIQPTEVTTEQKSRHKRVAHVRSVIKSLKAGLQGHKCLVVLLQAQGKGPLLDPYD